MSALNMMHTVQYIKNQEISEQQQNMQALKFISCMLLSMHPAERYLSSSFLRPYIFHKLAYMPAGQKA